MASQKTEYIFFDLKKWQAKLSVNKEKMRVQKVCLKLGLDLEAIKQKRSEGHTLLKYSVNCRPKCCQCRLDRIMLQIESADDEQDVVALRTRASQLRHHITKGREDAAILRDESYKYKPQLPHCDKQCPTKSDIIDIQRKIDEGHTVRKNTTLCWRKCGKCAYDKMLLEIEHCQDAQELAALQEEATKAQYNLTYELKQRKKRAANKAHYEKNKTKILEQQRETKKAKKMAADQRNAKKKAQKLYREQHPDHVKETKKTWYQRNKVAREGDSDRDTKYKEARNESSKKYYEKNKTKILERQRERKKAKKMAALQK